MKVELKLFAVAKQLAGCETVAIELPERATIGQLRAALAEQVPALAEVASSCLFAMNTEYVGDGASLVPDAELACIPPVSGG